ncbi:MAG TPA: flagellar protein FlaG [Thermotogota bacterium]|nr:flagellar protein FlaG [Thermotogota bacterium]HPJ88715.1 flagellar protein FlaG [Thermotogota bacterium]HPR95936.1 flagellar protein FlaG [Thermotogota bacterium]
MNINVDNKLQSFDVVRTENVRSGNPEKKEASKQEIKDPKKVDIAIQDFEAGIKALEDLYNGELRIEFDKEADMKVVKIVDRDNGEIIKEIPPESMVELSKKINEMIGILFDEMA